MNTIVSATLRFKANFDWKGHIGKRAVWTHGNFRVQSGELISLHGNRMRIKLNDGRIVSASGLDVMPLVQRDNPTAKCKVAGEAEK